MNFAGVYRAPIVFFCRNNGWAISLPTSKQSASKTLAIKASTYGFEGIRVDGNDALACYAITSWALEKARNGGGPTFIEALTFRMGPHSTADEPKRYRTEDDIGRWSSRDPIAMLKSHLLKSGLWDDAREDDLFAEYGAAISASVERQESAPLLSPEQLIFDDVYKEMLPSLKEQKMSAF